MILSTLAINPAEAQFCSAITNFPQPAFATPVKALNNKTDSIEKNISLLAEAKNTSADKLTVCLLDRPRHEKFINSLKKMGVNLKLITDGDVSGVIYVVDEKSPVDMYIGVGGGPEGVLAAAALSCYGGQMQTRLVLNENESRRANEMGITDLKKKYNINDMIKGDIMFCATAITGGDLAEGIKDHKEFYEANTFALHKSAKIKTLYRNKHKK